MCAVAGAICRWRQAGRERGSQLAAVLWWELSVAAIIGYSWAGFDPQPSGICSCKALAAASCPCSDLPCRPACHPWLQRAAAPGEAHPPHAHRLGPTAQHRPVPRPAAGRVLPGWKPALAALLGCVGCVFVSQPHPRSQQLGVVCCPENFVLAHTPGCCCRCCPKQATMAECSRCRRSSRRPPAPPWRQWQPQQRQQRRPTAHRWRGSAICWQRAALMPAGRMAASWWQLRGGAPRSSSRRGGAAAGSSDCTRAVWPSVKIERSFFSGSIWTGDVRVLGVDCWLAILARGRVGRSGASGGGGGHEAVYHCQLGHYPQTSWATIQAARPLDTINHEGLQCQALRVD